MVLSCLAALFFVFARTMASPLATGCGDASYFINGCQTKNFQLGPNTDCTYSFNWRTGSGSIVGINIDGIDNSTLARVWNDFPGGKDIYFGMGRTGQISNTLNTYFAPGTLNFRLKTGPTNNINATITINVANSTRDSFPVTSQVITGSQPIVISDNLDEGFTYVYTSTSKIVLSVTSPFDGSGINYFDSVFVYDGQGPTANLLGTLRDFDSGSTTILSGNVISLYPIGQKALAGKAVINNQENIGAFNPSSMVSAFSYTTSPSDAFTSEVVLDSRNGQGTTSILSFGAGANRTADYPIVTGITFSEPTAVIQVFSGLPTNKMAGNYIKQYTADSVQNMSPQSFPGTAVTFTINRGYAGISYISALHPPPK